MDLRGSPIDGSITGAEALVRWHHPERGILSPAAFLPALEGGPLAATVGSWILNEADEGQGYLFGKPMSVLQFELMLGIGNSARASA